MRISGALRRVTLARPRGSGPSSRKPRNLVNIRSHYARGFDAYTQQRPNKLAQATRNSVHEGNSRLWALPPGVRYIGHKGVDKGAKT